MHHKPRGLIDDDERIVLVNNVQRNGFGRMTGFNGMIRWLDLDLFSAPHLLFGNSLSSIHAYPFVANPCLEAGARPVWQQPRQSLVEPYPGKPLGYYQLDGGFSRV